MHFKKLFIFLFTLFFQLVIFSRIYIVKSFSYSNFDEIIAGIKNELSGIPIGEYNLSNIDSLNIEDNEKNICFTLGEKAYKYIINHYKKIVIIALMIFDNSLYVNNNRTIFIKPILNLGKRILLIKKIVKNLKGVIIPCSSRWYEKNHDSYEEILLKKGIRLQFVIIDDDVGITFEKLNVPHNYIVLSVYDTNIYNQNNIFFIFRIIYEKKIPFVGFSMGFIKNGSFLALEPDYFEMGKYSVSILKKAMNEKINYITYAEKFNVLINGKILNDFGFNLDLTYKEIKVIK